MPKLLAELQNMAESDILRMIDPGALDELKKEDPRPEIRVYRIAHEGTAEGTLLDKGKKKNAAFRYVADAIRKLVDHLNINTPLFRGHTDTNSHAGRKKIGRVIGKQLRDVGGQLQAFAATYIYPEHSGEILDVASVEAPFRFAWENGAVRVEDFQDITGIALGDGRYDRPAFTGATLLGAMQAFAEQGGSEDVELTADAVKAAIKDGTLKVSPSDLFTADALLKDSAVSDKIAKTGFEAARRVRDEELKPVQTELETAKKSLDTVTQERDQAKSEALKNNRATIFDSVAKERKLTDKQRGFVERNWDRFKTEATEEGGVKTDMNKFLDGQLEEYAEYEKLFGSNSDGNGKTEKGKEVAAEGQAGDDDMIIEE